MRLTPSIYGHYIKQPAGARLYYVMRDDGTCRHLASNWSEALLELAYTAADARQKASQDYTPGYHRKTVSAVLRAVRRLSHSYHQQAYSIELAIQYGSRPSS